MFPVGDSWIAKFADHLNFHTNCRIKFAGSLFLLNVVGGLLELVQLLGQVVHGLGEVEYLCEVESSYLYARRVPGHVICLVPSLSLPGS